MGAVKKDPNSFTKKFGERNKFRSRRTEKRGGQQSGTERSCEIVEIRQGEVRAVFAVLS